MNSSLDIGGIIAEGAGAVGDTLKSSTSSIVEMFYANGNFTFLGYLALFAVGAGLIWFVVKLIMRLVRGAA